MPAERETGIWPPFSEVADVARKIADNLVFVAAISGASNPVAAIIFAWIAPGRGIFAGTVDVTG